jgi:hypothetical protein
VGQTCCTSNEPRDDQWPVHGPQFKVQVEESESQLVVLMFALPDTINL